MADISQSGSYPKIVKPPTKASWTKQLFDHWKRAWYFERLLVVLSVIAAPFVVCFVADGLAAEIALKLEAGHFAASLTTLKVIAKEHNSFGYLTTSTPQAGTASYYDLSYSKEELGSKRVHLPTGFSVLGQIVFDPLGVPDSPTDFTVRHGLRVTRVHVDSQGFVSQQ